MHAVYEWIMQNKILLNIANNNDVLISDTISVAHIGGDRLYELNAI